MQEKESGVGRGKGGEPNATPFASCSPGISTGSRPESCLNGGPHSEDS